MNENRKQGPNVRKLIVRKMTFDAVPRQGGGLDTALKYLSDPAVMTASAKAATSWAFMSIDAVRNAPGGESFGDDEAIAAEILRRAEAKT